MLLGIALLSGCAGRRPVEPEEPAYRPRVIQPRTPPPPPEEPATPPAPVYVPPAYQVVRNPDAAYVEPISNFDVLHTTLDLGFDFPGERVIGTATHTLRTLVSGMTRLTFDGRDMEIHSATLGRRGATRTPLEVQYDGQTLILVPPQPLGIDTFDVAIAYTAHPTRNGQRLGMNFVDGAGTDASKPTQIWTLGQPEDNRYWYPGWDYPNDPVTVDVLLTVPASYTTVSNGGIVGQEQLANGMRRDHWRLTRPHASYLTGLVVGEFASVIDRYVRRDGSQVPLAYIVEPAYASKTSLIFGETPRMMGLFEDATAVAYPWGNYKQVTVRDFTAGGMENTTATVLFDELQHDERAQLDFNGRDLISHELAHQWFGDLLTIRNWANLALNEGFASYFERIYIEGSAGIDEAQAHTIEERDLYLKEAESMRRPIIWYGYTDPNAMYDRHTYEKMALVLHQLRFELGDVLWYNGIRKYVRDNASRTVVADDLRKAMEQASGRNLGFFFNQWLLQPGHPELDVTHTFDPNRGLYEIRVRQVQDSLLFLPFRFDVQVELNIQGGTAPFMQRFTVADRDTTFRFALAGDVTFARFDVGDWLLADIHVDKPLSEWIAQVRGDDEMAGRYDAVVALGELEPTNEIRDAILQTLVRDPHHTVRQAAAAALNGYAGDPVVRQTLSNTARTDTDAAVRKAALLSLSRYADSVLLSTLRGTIADPSYAVTAESVRLFARAYPNEALPAMRSLFEVDSWKSTVELAMIEGYSTIAAVEGIPYLEARLNPAEPEDVRAAAADAMGVIARAQPGIGEGVGRSLVALLDDGIEMERFSAAQALRSVNIAPLREDIRRCLAKETSARVRSQLEQLVGL
ncbi:MAG: M1 family aminopeptidase [Rhodothermales bacterium]